MLTKTNFRFKFNEPKIVPSSVYSAWIPYWDTKRVEESLDKSSGKLKHISPMWYKLDTSGSFNLIEKANQNTIAQTSAQNMDLFPLITNEFDPKRVGELLHNKKLSDMFINDAIKTAQEKGFKGYDLDFEEINLSDKENFSIFVKQFSESLHKNGLLLLLSVHAQTGSNSDWPSARAQDWKTLSRYADFIQIMAYDFHNSKTKPGPVTPIINLKPVLKYATSVIPLEKIVIGLPLYGYDWGKENNSVEFQNAKEKIEKNKGSFTRDDNSLELIGKYKSMEEDREIWIEDARSVLYKVSLGRFYGIYQFKFWRLGGEDLTLWDKL